MEFIVLGAGGTGRTIGGILREGGTPFFFLDDALKGQTVNGTAVKGPVGDFEKYAGARFIVGYGVTYLEDRIATYERLKERGRGFFNAVHPGVYVDETASLGDGVMLAANCAVLPNATVGDNCVFCVASTVDHDCKVGDHCYVSPGVNLAGGVTVGKAVFIGTNAAVLPLVKVGDHAVIGAGAVVTEDVAPHTTVVGVPARPIRKKGSVKER